MSTAFDALVHALLRCHDEGVTGILRVSGSPGGAFHLQGGFVVAVDSPGAPGAEALLLRKGRISEDEWTTARPAAADRIGVTALQVVALAAAHDGAFAVAAGDIGDLDVVPPDEVSLPLATGVEPLELLRETARRLDALASLPFPVSPYRERFVPAPDVASAVVSPARQQILASATGRRSARDVAFAIGRSVYPVTVEVSRMLGEHLLAITTEAPVVTPPTRLDALRPRHAAASAEKERNDVGL